LVFAIFWQLNSGDITLSALFGCFPGEADQLFAGCLVCRLRVCFRSYRRNSAGLTYLLLALASPGAPGRSGRRAVKLESWRRGWRQYYNTVAVALRAETHRLKQTRPCPIPGATRAIACSLARRFNGINDQFTAVRRCRIIIKISG
jgi:hypothetical protein